MNGVDRDTTIKDSMACNDNIVLNAHRSVELLEKELYRTTVGSAVVEDVHVSFRCFYTAIKREYIFVKLRACMGIFSKYTLIHTRAVQLTLISAHLGTHER